MYAILLSMPLLQPPKKKRRTGNIEIPMTTKNDAAEIVPHGGHVAIENITALKIGQPVVDGLNDGYAAVIVRKTQEGVHIVYPGDYEHGYKLYKAYIQRDDVWNRLRMLQQQCPLLGHQFYGEENCVATISHVEGEYFLTIYEDGSYKYETEESMLPAVNRSNLSSACLSEDLWTQ
jgi:hypothetical protein